MNNTKHLSKSFNDFFGEGFLIKNLFHGVSDDTPELIVKTITFQVTEQCSLACTYCYETHKTNKRMKLEDAKKFIDLLIEESYKEDSFVYVGHTKALVIEFIGGEPLMEIELIHEIMDYFIYKTTSEKHIWSVNFMISMISNGVSYFDHRVQDLFDKYKNRLSFSMSMDGCKELHDACRVFHNGEGSYDIVEKACVHYLTNYDPNMQTKMTIAPENIHYIEKAFLNLLRLNYKVIFANPIYETNWTEEHASIYYKQLKKVADIIIERKLYNEVYISIFDNTMFTPMRDEDNQNYCGSTGSMLALDCEGDIYPCIRFMKTSLGCKQKPIKIGDIHSGIGRKPEDRKLVNLLDSITRKSQSTQECINCTIASGCGWCTALNYQETGSVNKRLTNICNMHKARALANVYYWNNIYKKEGVDDIFKINMNKDDIINIVGETEAENLIKLMGNI